MFEPTPYLKITRFKKGYFDFKSLTADELATIYQGLELLERLNHENTQHERQQIKTAQHLKTAIEHNRY